MISLKKYLSLLLGTAVAIGVAYFGGLAILGSQYTKIDDFFGFNHILTPSTTFGVVLVLLGTCFGPLLLGWSLLVTAQQRRLPPTATLAMCATIFTLSLLICSHSWVGVILPAETASSSPDSLRQFLGGLAFFSFAPLALCSAWVCVQLGSEKQTWGGKWQASFAPLTQETLASGGASLALLLLLPLAITLVTASALLPPIWTTSATQGFAISADKGGTADSWSLLPVTTALARTGISKALVYVKLYSDVVVFYTFLLVVGGLGVVGTYSPSLRRWLHKRLRAPPSLPPLRYLFPQGVCLGELILATALGGLYVYWCVYWGVIYTRFKEEVVQYGDKSGGSFLQPAARLLGHLTTLTMSLLCFPVARNSVLEAVFGLPFDRAMKVHRFLGALTWVLVTLHMLAWQLKWAGEGVLRANVATVNRLQVTPCGFAPKVPGGCFNDALGRAFLTSQGLIGPVSGPTTCGCAWYTRYDNITGQPVGSPDFTYSPRFAGLAPAWHVDNWTVLVGEFAWLLLTGALVFALACRRKHYHLFLITHYAALFFFAVALVHAWAHWVYASAGLLLFALDKVLRVVGSARKVRVVGGEVWGGVGGGAGCLVLVLAADFLRGKPLFAGQYVWLNVGEVGLSEWHPFTISSPPSAAAAGATAAAAAGDEWEGEEEEKQQQRSSVSGSGGGGVLTFHIKINGKGSWTERLAGVIKGASGKGCDSLSVSVDGPYGRLNGVEDAEHLVLFAGGVGVTPFMSLLGEILARGGGGGGGAGKRATLVWAIREEEWLEVFAGTLGPLVQLQQQSSWWCEVQIYLTSGEKTAPGGGGASGMPSPPAGKETDSLLGGGGGGGKGGGGRIATLGATKTGRGGAMTWARSGDLEAVKGAVRQGRPNVGDILRSVVKTRRGGEGVLAMVCGPEPLVEAVSEAAFACGTDFHMESFTF